MSRDIVKMLPQSTRFCRLLVRMLLAVLVLAWLAVPTAFADSVQDDFESGGYSGGSCDWSGDWQEGPPAQEADGPGSGNVQVVSSAHCALGSCLTLIGDGSDKDFEAVRELDLSSATTATLTFNYKRVNYYSCRTRVQASGNGGSSWTTLATYNTIDGDDPGVQSSGNLNLTPYLASNTQIRFIVDDWCDPEPIYIDDIDISHDASSTCGNNAVTSAVAEISPTSVNAGSTGNAFTYDLLPTIGGSDTGVNQIAITAPAGYANLTITSVSLGGVAQTASGSCPSVGSGEYCATVAGQVMTVTLGSKVTVSLTNIQIGFSADAPGSAGSAAFTATVDDDSTGTAAQATTAGNADGDAGDANTQTVSVVAMAIVKQAWLENGSAPLASPSNAAVGSTIVFLIYVKNTTGSALNDVRINDALDETGFDYVAGSLVRTSAGSPPADTASDLAIFNATAPGTGTVQTDGVDGDVASAQDSGGPATVDRITIGAVTGQANGSQTITANTTFALRFRVKIK